MQITNPLTQVIEIPVRVGHGARRKGGGARAPMPRYFFHLYDDVDTLDEEGLELADFKAAQARGLQDARDMAAESVKNGHLTLHHRVEVADEQGKVLMTIPFADVVAILE